jgi:hypothetical protein
MTDTPAAPICYRCGKTEQAGETFRLLPGSSQITLCPDCSVVVWGWHEQPAGAPPEARPDDQKAPGGRN